MSPVEEPDEMAWPALWVVLVLALATASCQKPPALVEVPGHLVLATRGTRPESYERRLAQVLRALGFEVQTRPVASLARGGIPLPVFVPHTAAARMSKEDAIAVRRQVEDGLLLAVEGEGPLASALGITFQNRTVEVSGGRGSRRYELIARWKTSLTFRPFTADARAAFLSADGIALEAEGRLRKGRFVFFAVPVLAPDGQVRYPGLGEILWEVLAAGPPPLLRPAVEVFFDPAYRSGVPPVELARLWRSQRIRAVHVAGWYGPTGYAYAQLVDALHRSGLRAYLWLTPPMVTRQLWGSRPECRERTASGTDTTSDWRSLFALEDPACLAFALPIYEAMLRAAPWDGVNLAELYFAEAYLGPDHPEGYTPFHAWVRGHFAGAHGFDPREIFNPASAHYMGRSRSGLNSFEAYRSRLLTDLHRRLLAFLVPRLEGKDLVLTLIDDVLDPRLARNIGLDARAVLALRREFSFRLLVEDPFTVWSWEPERYARLRSTWARRTRGFSFDLNVVDRDDPNPTARMAGAELARAVLAAGDEVAIYAESTVSAEDWKTVQTALARSEPVRAQILQAEGGTYVIRTRRAVLFRPSQRWEAAVLDGSLTRLGADGLFWIPPGTHRIAAAPAPPQDWQLIRTSCELLAVERGGERIRYTSPSPCYAVITASSPRPAASLDGTPAPDSMWAGGDGGLMLSLPAGEHTLDLSSRSP